MDKRMRIYLSDVLYLLRKKWKFVVMLTLCGLVLGLVFQGMIVLRGHISKSYTVTATAIFIPQNENGSYQSDTGKSDRNTYLLSEDMAEAVITVLKSQQMLDYVVQKTNLSDVKSKSIKSNLSITAGAESPVISFSLSWRNAEEGKRIMSSILSNSTYVLRKVLGTGRLSVIEQPAAVRAIVGGRSKTIFLSTFLGFFIALLVLLVDLLFKPTLINVIDVNAELRLKVLSVIARGTSKDDSKRRKSLESLTYVVINKVRDTTNPVMYLTSTKNGEGKTFTAVHLAKHLSRLEKDVLLIDLDIKGPAIGTFFEGTSDYSHSLNALYKGEIDPVDAVVTVNGHLDVMPTMLEHDSFSIEADLLHIIKSLSKNYDYTIIDAPALYECTDALMINQIADHVLFVIGFDMATKKEIKSAVKILNDAGAPILGSIVTNEFSVEDSVKLLQLTDRINRRAKKEGDAEAAEPTKSYKLMNTIFGKSDDADKSDEQAMTELIEYGLNGTDHSDKTDGADETLT